MTQRPAAAPPAVFRALLSLVLLASWVGAAAPACASAAAPSAAAVEADPAAGVGPGGAASEGWGAKLRRALWIFLIASLVALVLLIATAAFLLWRARQLVENAVRPNLPALERVVAAQRRRHPDLDPGRLAKKLITRQANRAGLVGFLTGLGGMPALPIALPIDLALTVKVQSNLVHMLRLVDAGRVRAEEISEASLWLITTGGQELTSASSTLVRELVVRYLSKSLLKFLPLVGGLVGFLLNWMSTQALGRLTLQWLEGRAGSPHPTLSR